VTFCRSGGLLAGNELETTVSTTDLDEQARTTLEGHLEQADVEQLAVRSPILGRGADMYQYDLTIERGARRVHLVVSQTAIPEKLRPLVRWLEQRAAERR